jgi:hypothetical protein
LIFTEHISRTDPYRRPVEDFADPVASEVSGPPQVIDYGHGQSEDTEPQHNMDYGQGDDYNRDRDYGRGHIFFTFYWNYVAVNYCLPWSCNKFYSCGRKSREIGQKKFGQLSNLIMCKTEEYAPVY